VPRARFRRFALCCWDAVLLFLAALHVYWAMGANWGSSVSVPTIAGRRVINPTPFATYVVAFLLVMGAIVICGQAHLFALGRFSALFRAGSWCLCGVFLLRAIGNFKTFGIFKTVRANAFAFWDTRLYSPLCLVLAVLAAWFPQGATENENRAADAMEVLAHKGYGPSKLS
jgi:hypothetical protein